MTKGSAEEPKEPGVTGAREAGESKAFLHLRVLDLSEKLSGAYAARMFADFGADVVLAEPPEGHPLRGEPPFLDDRPGLDRSVMHAYANWNKRSVAVRDADDVERLAETADVLVTNAIKPWSDAIARAVDALEAGAIHLSITPHGLDGPLSGVCGNSLTACARTGWCTINRLVDERPLQLPVRQTGYIAGVAGFVGAAAALWRRERTGAGERVDVSEVEALALTNAPWAMLGLFVGGHRLEYGPNGPRYRGEPAPLWQTSNGPMNLSFGDWGRWQEALRFLGLDELAEDEVYAPRSGRNTKDLKPVRAALAGAVATRDKWEVFHELSRLRCPSGVVQDARELAESEQSRAREFVVSTQVGGRELRATGAPARLSGTPWRLSRPAPGLDAHGDEIRKERRRSRTSQRGDLPADLAMAPLTGLRVLAFTQAWAGTFGTELLALLGADVVQVESPTRPDIWRGVGAPVPPAVRRPDIEQSGLNTNGLYNSVNMNKRAVTLDMRHPRGKEIFWRLVPRFDVVADNFSPHVMPGWGVTLQTLRKAREDIIFASVSGFGTQGPFSEYPANGHTTEPMSGLSSIHGYEGDSASNTGGLIPDPISGYYFAAAILTALNYRERTAQGQRIDAAMMEAVAVQIGDAVMELDATGRIRRPQGNRHPKFAPHGVYKAAGESWIAIGVETEPAWEALARHIGLDDPRFADMASRKANEGALDGMLARWCAELDAEGTAATLGRLGVCAATIGSFDAVYANPSPQFRERGFTVPVTHPESGTHFLPLAPWLLSARTRPPTRYSPRFGEHSREVLRTELGIADQEYEELEALGVTGIARKR